MAAIKMEALESGWRIVGRVWSRKAREQVCRAVLPSSLQGQIVAEVLRLMPQGEDGRVKFADVKSALNVTSQGKWSAARSAASTGLEQHGIATEGRSWVRSPPPGSE